MRKLLTPSVLSLLVGASAMASVILCVMHIQYTRTLRSIQGTQQQLLAVQRNQTMMNGLVSDLISYGKTNSAIRPLLDSISIKPVKP
jgi:hypothetical protein